MKNQNDIYALARQAHKIIKVVNKKLDAVHIKHLERTQENKKAA
jgi:hypothetical protein